MSLSNLFSSLIETGLGSRLSAAVDHSPRNQVVAGSTLLILSLEPKCVLQIGFVIAYLYWYSFVNWTNNCAAIGKSCSICIDRENSIKNHKSKVFCQEYFMEQVIFSSSFCAQMVSNVLHRINPVVHSLTLDNVLQH